MLETTYNAFIEWTINNQIGLIGTIILASVYLFITRITLPKIKNRAQGDIEKSQNYDKAHHMIKILSRIVTIALLLALWGMDFSGLLLLSTSILTLTGVALFANWSILSNITSFFIMHFHTSFRKGVYLRIIDADNYIEGYIYDIGFINTTLKTYDGEFIIYPNNLLLAKPIFIEPKVRFAYIGKINESTLGQKKSEPVEVRIVKANRDLV